MQAAKDEGNGPKLRMHPQSLPQKGGRIRNYLTTAIKLPSQEHLRPTANDSREKPQVPPLKCHRSPTNKKTQHRRRRDSPRDKSNRVPSMRTREQGDESAAGGIEQNQARHRSTTPRRPRVRGIREFFVGEQRGQGSEASGRK